MAAITFSADEKQRIVERIRRYFADELKQEIGRFDAEFLLDFFASEIGPDFYNRGLRDAQAVLASRIDDLQDAITLLERPSDTRG
jgi:uncharacterized protein (DUF2164 family)